MSNIFIDTETCGFHGPICLIQYAIEDGPIVLFSPWQNDSIETLKLIEMIASNTVVGFNLTYDWFHLCQMYTTLLRLDPDCPPTIELYAREESAARFGPCLKPAHCLDLMLHARKGPYQSTMDRSDIRIKRIPRQISAQLAEELDRRIPLKDVYFARKADKKRRWTVMETDDNDFDDIVLKFAPSSALKALAQDALKIDDVKFFAEVEVDKAWAPEEYGYAPFNDVTTEGWPKVIRHHISHWCYNSIARKYAEDDIVYTRGLYEYFNRPQVDDDDSILACMVGACRWRGYAVNIEGLKKLKEEQQQVVDGAKYNFASIEVCKRYLTQVMSDTEKMAISPDGKMTTKSKVLEEIAKWKVSDVCNHCDGIGCNYCEQTGLINTDEKHPAAIRAQEILDVRHAKKEVEIYDKLLMAGRFHASLNIIGALSGRMSGSDGLNAQGIKRAKYVRQCFPLADGDLVLCGGDFAGFEVVLADACYGDPELRADLISGKKIHALFGEYLFPHLTYEQIMESKGLPNEQDKYSLSKNGVFAMLYGGEAFTLTTRVGVTQQAADEAYHRWCQRYKVWGQKRKEYFDMFCSMRQPNGIGSKVEWSDPHDYIESMFGFRRYFTLENRICKALFNLAESPPKHWEELKMRVVRRDREQTACGAARSALFAAAFALQASNMRAAANHVIQSSGSSITKALQRRIWELQPVGISDWKVQPLNVHDEIMCPAHPDAVPMVRQIVESFVKEMASQVPLIEIDWSDKLKTWADK